MTWNYLLQHLGRWRGSFTRLSPQGEVEEDIPSLVTLEGLNQNQTIHQVVQHFDRQTKEAIYEKVLEYSSLSRSTLVFENGAFSQGSTQLGPLSEFGAEFGFVEGDRRMRLVELFKPGGELDRLTLIREHQEGTDAPERPPLQVEDLLGDWQGEVVTLYADLRSPETVHTELQLKRQGDTLTQYMSGPDFNLRSTARIEGDRLQFQEGAYPVQVLLLPDGASCTCPPVLPKGQGFFLEAGWLVARDRRYRMIRRYDAQGGWTSLSLVTEHKTA